MDSVPIRRIASLPLAGAARRNLGADSRLGTAPGPLSRSIEVPGEAAVFSVNL